jgi:hypothetical protein
MSPEEIVGLIDFRYITDALTPEEALELLTRAQEGKEARLQEALESKAVPAYTTSAGWLGYGEDKMKGLLQETLAKGYRHFKLKVGGDLEQDKKRLGIAREVIGYDQGNVLMVDANQVWSVPEAIEYMTALKEFKPWFIEEPTSPDDGMLFSLPFLLLLPSTPLSLPQIAHTSLTPPRSPRPQSHPHSPGPLLHRRRDGRNVPKPRNVQAIPVRVGNRHLPNRRVPPRRRQRSPGCPPHGREIQRPHRPAQRRRRPARVHAAPEHHRLCRRQWKEECARVRGSFA